MDDVGHVRGVGAHLQPALHFEGAAGWQSWVPNRGVSRQDRGLAFVRIAAALIFLFVLFGALIN